MSDLDDLEEIEALTRRGIDLHSQTYFKSARARSKVVRAAAFMRCKATASDRQGRSQKKITLPTINSLREL